MRKTVETITTMNRIISHVNERTPRSKLVSSRPAERRVAIAPN